MKISSTETFLKVYMVVSIVLISCLMVYVYELQTTINKISDNTQNIVTKAENDLSQQIQNDCNATTRNNTDFNCQ